MYHQKSWYQVLSSIQTAHSSLATCQAAFWGQKLLLKHMLVWLLFPALKGNDCHETQDITDELNRTEYNRRERWKDKPRPRHYSDITQHLHRHMRKGTPDHSTETFPEKDRSSLQQCPVTKSHLCTHPLHICVHPSLKRQDSRLPITSYRASNDATGFCSLCILPTLPSWSPCSSYWADEREILLYPTFWSLSPDSCQQ